MTRDPGEWYEEKRLEAERLGHELVGARAVLEAVLRRNHVLNIHDAAREVVRRLERRLEAARYVGD